jgi:hypothetical protein
MKFEHPKGFKITCDSWGAFLVIVAKYWPETRPEEWKQTRDVNNGL